MLKVIRIEPAATCNLKCIHCPTGSLNNPVKGIMSLEVFDNIIKQIQSIKTIKVVVLYHGGEPLLNKNLFYMIESLKKLNYEKVKLVSNGMLLDQKRVFKLIDAGLDEIEISLDGKDLEENNKIRLGCDGSKVVDNIKVLLETIEKKRAHLKVTVSSTLLQEEDVIKNINNSFTWIDEIFEKEVRNNMMKIQKNQAMVWNIMNIDKDKLLTYEKDSNELNYCEHIYETITVRYNGDVVPCCYDLTSAMVMGNILDDELFNIFHNKLYEKLRNSIKLKKFNAICKNCAVVNRKSFLSWR